jgi:hypothetical protein
MEPAFSFDFIFVGYVNKRAIFKNNMERPAYLFSPEDSTFIMRNADDVIKISDHALIRQKKIGKKKYKIIIYNKLTKNMHTIYSNEELYPFDIDVDSTVTYIAYSRISNDISEIVVKNLKNQSEFVIQGIFPKIIDNRLFYFNYNNHEESTDVTGKIYCIDLKESNLKKIVILDNIIYEEYKVYSLKYLIFGRFISGETKHFLYNLKTNEKKMIKIKYSPLFSYYSFMKNKIVFYDFNEDLSKLEFLYIDPENKVQNFK